MGVAGITKSIMQITQKTNERESELVSKRERNDFINNSF